MGCLKLNPEFLKPTLKVVYRHPVLKEKEVQRFLSVDPRTDKYPGWSPFNYVLGNPIANIDPNGDTTRVYNNVGELQYQVGESKDYEDHFYSNEVLKNLNKMTFESESDKETTYRMASDYFIGPQTRKELKNMRDNKIERGFVVAPGPDRQLHVFETSHLTKDRNARKFEPDLAAYAGLVNYKRLVGTGHTHTDNQGPSPLLGIDQLSDYTPILNRTLNDYPGHLAIVVGTDQFIIYTTVRKSYIHNYGWDWFKTGETSTIISFSGNKRK